MSAASSTGSSPAPGREGPVITLDGPAGSGKSSTARAVARRLGFRHLDSGALYRALTWALLDDGVPPDAWPDMSESDFRALRIRMEPTAEGYRISRRGRPVEDDRLRTPEVTDRVSHLAGIPAVRGCLLALQRDAGAAGRLVADGRDMGTVVFPDAELKVYLVADLEERARRRLLERSHEGDPDGAAVRDEARALAGRDERDSSRDVSPLRKADDAWELDTTGLDFEAQVDAVVQRARRLTLP
ncbi:MAG: (d)CMP kinase [Longimicrobiales bacterium]